MINFVTNLPRDLRSGGFSAMNVAAHRAVSAEWPTHYAGPIDPPRSTGRWALSKLRRLAGLPGDFFFFSEERLRRIAREVTAQSQAEAAFDFFHGFTPWILTRPDRPYMAWGDCTFVDYIDIYHRAGQFRRADLARIEDAEAAWLRNARRVAFTSHWAAERAVARYGLAADRVVNVGIFGEAELPDADGYAGGQDFVFISTDFRAKGGLVVVEAFKALRAEFPGCALTVVGDAPPAEAMVEGVGWAGFLHKEVEAEARRFRDILAGARAVVHPTRSDIAPLLIVEAGYFGCPVVASRRYAIPEMVEDGVSGRLVDDPQDAAAVRDAMAAMLRDGEAYARMRKAAWSRARARFAKADFNRRLVDCVRAALSSGEAAG